jgi:hypothetical protein
MVLHLLQQLQVVVEEVVVDLHPLVLLVEMELAIQEEVEVEVHILTLVYLQLAGPVVPES